jgi:hypothetical protein
MLNSLRHNTHGQKKQESSIINLFQLMSHAKENESRGFPTLTSTRIHANQDWPPSQWMLQLVV